MKIIGLNKDDSPIIAEDKSLIHARNIVVSEDNQSYKNENGLDLIYTIKNNSDISNLELCGIITTNIGFVCFFKDKSNNEGYDYIQYYINDESGNISLIKNIRSKYFKFNKIYPITGDYTYSYKGDLIITFTEGVDDNANETRIININDPKYNNDDSELITLSELDVTLLNLIPDVQYPTLYTEVGYDGNLRTGAYQVAIRFKLLDSTYTNYSIFHPSIIIASKDTQEDYEIGLSVSRSIKVSFSNEDYKYKHYSLAILYKDSESERIYETGDLTLKSFNEYIISNIDSYSIITLEDVMVQNISYIKDECHVNFNNRLIRGNVKTINYDDLDETLKNAADNIKVSLEYISKESAINSEIRYFKTNEVYSLYIGFHDYKGNLVNIYKIPHKQSDDTEAYEKTNRSNHLIPSKDILVDSNKSTAYTIQEETEDFKYKFNIYPQLQYDSISVSESINVRGEYEMYLYRITENDIPNIPLNTQLISLYSNSTSKRFYFKIYNHIYFSGVSKIKLKYTIKDVNIITGEIYEIIENEFILESDSQFEIEYDRFFTVENLERPRILRDLYMTYDIEPYIEEGSDVENIELYNITLNGYFDKISRVISSNSVAIIKTSIPDDIIPLIPNSIKSFSMYMVEHDFSNSRILSQCVGLRDMVTNDMGNNQVYKGQFASENKLRLYPYEFLFNKKTNIPCIVKTFANISNDKIIHDGDRLPSAYQCEDEVDYTTSVGVVIKGKSRTVCTSHIDIKISDIVEIKDLYGTETSIKYINNNNSQLNNTAGESYYRYEGYLTGIIPRNDKFALMELYNIAENLYVTESNQKLQIISSIYNIKKGIEVRCIGDTFMSYLTLRACAPASKFKIGGTTEEASNFRVWRWIFTFPIESKFNIKARYSVNNIDKSFKLEGVRNVNDLIPLYGINYQVDNFINTSTGKGYSTVYNENGIQEYPYFENIIGINHHMSRIVRSNVFNTESEALTWRYFDADDYLDIPNNRGDIVSLKTDNTNLYIQQRYGLRIASLKDKLSNTEEGTSYLGSSDLFDREPTEVLYDPSGYIGCSSKFDTIVTLFGYFVVDNKKGKIFHVYGQEPKEISAIKMYNWFKNKIDKSDINNPFIGQGRYFIFNENTKNIHYIQQNINNQFNISFSCSTSKWISEHDYIPIYAINNRNDILLFNIKDNNIDIYNFNRFKYGMYFDNITFESIIKFIFNTDALQDKLLQNIAWIDTVFIQNGDLKHIIFEDTINEICVHNDDQISGFRTVEFNSKWYSGKTGVNKVNIWRFNNIKDIAKHGNFLINEYTINLDALKKNPKWYNINEFISRHIFAIIKFNNKNNNRCYELNEINAEWTSNNRNN